jgi:hypothetical protein
VLVHGTRGDADALREDIAHVLARLGLRLSAAKTQLVLLRRPQRADHRRLLAKLFPHRDDYVLATKVCFPMGPGPNDGGLSRKHILAAIDDSLSRLGTDHVDLYQIHRWDGQTSIQETMEALHDVVRAGKARYIGASSMYAWQFAKAQHTATAAGWTRFISMQNHYNLLCREEEREMIPLCLDQGVGCIPWSPLARGLLAGNRERGGQQRTVRAGSDPLADQFYGDDDFHLIDTVRAVAAERGLPRRRSRSPGCSASPRSPHRSSGQPSSTTSTTRSPRSTSPCTRTRWPAWRLPTAPTRSLATTEARPQTSTLVGARTSIVGAELRVRRRSLGVTRIAAWRYDCAICCSAR